MNVRPRLRIRRSWLTVLLLPLALGLTGCQQMILRVVGMEPFLGPRVTGWVEGGAVESDVRDAMKRIYKPMPSEVGKGSWTYEMSIPAREHEAAAIALEADGNLEAACKEYTIAAAQYGIARYPFLATPQKRYAYQKHIECYLLGARTLDPPLELVRIPYQDNFIIGYLRIPQGVPGGDPPPVIVTTGGIDTWKGASDNYFKAALAEGMAAFAFDMPGTGESPWPLAPDSDHVYSRVFEYLKSRPDLDGESIGLYARSFSGLFAVKLALVDPNLKAAVNLGGPIAKSFTREHAETLPPAMTPTVQYAMHGDPDISIEDGITVVTQMSLAEQGLLHKPDRQAHLLSINGTNDPLVDIDDVYIISRSGIEQEEWIFEGDGHCAPENAHKHVPESMAWLKARMSE